MRSLLISFLSFFVFLSSACSQDHENLVREAEEKLKTGKATISQLLTDKKYDAVHPETSFRNIIEKYAKAETISIATDTIPGKKIKVMGSIKDQEGKPVVNALVYLYHTDSRGWYAANSPHVNMNE